MGRPRGGCTSRLPAGICGGSGNGAGGGCGGLLILASGRVVEGGEFGI